MQLVPSTQPGGEDLGMSAGMSEQATDDIPITHAMIAAAERVWWEGVRCKIGTGMLTAIYRAMRKAELAGKPLTGFGQSVLSEEQLASNPTQTTDAERWAYVYDADCCCPEGPPGSEPGWFCPFAHETYRDDCWGCRY